MKSFIVIATKGRAKETYVLLDYLTKQTYPIEKIIIVGSEPKDVENLELHPVAISKKTLILLSPKAGSCIQRNIGLDKIKAFTSNISSNDWFVTIFDDDFRPADNWIEAAATAFIDFPNVVGVGGWVLADGVHTHGLSEVDATNVLATKDNLNIKPWFGEQKEVEGLYGCNMAYRGVVASTERFDENLPLYGWQEDIDYGGNALKFGKLLYINQCKGVHLGVTSARTSGVRFGYSQIANPIYLVKKGTMSSGFALNLMSRNIASNILRTIVLNHTKDYKGRLYGNFVAFKDFILCKIHPLKILKL